MLVSPVQVKCWRRLEHKSRWGRSGSCRRSGSPHWIEILPEYKKEKQRKHDLVEFNQASILSVVKTDGEPSPLCRSNIAEAAVSPE